MRCAFRGTFGAVSAHGRDFISTILRSLSLPADEITSRAASIWSKAPVIAVSVIHRGDRSGGLRRDHWMAGAANLDGPGRIPNITPAGKNVKSWSGQRPRLLTFESGFTPDFDTVGSSMVAVQENLSKLPQSDLEAIAAYLKTIPAIESQK